MVQKKMLRHCAVVLCLLIAQGIFSQVVELADSPWNFLNTKRIGAYDFLKTNPTYDGRGVILVICDSGVDMGVPGLLKTSEGKIKVIDAQDFSGQGDILLSEAKIDSADETALVAERKNDTKDEITRATKTLRLTGFEQLTYQPEDSTYWMGCIDEERHFKNSGVKDINNNGTENDVFVFITFPVKVDDEERWVYYLDEDGDGNIQDEKPRFDYRIDYDTFTLRGRDVKKDKGVLTFALNILPDDKKASFHAGDNAHGTHCAGIAAGYQIFGEPTQHGIAPGAQVISCKIGDGSLAGGATTTGAKKKAFQYGVKYGKEHDVPIVFSMSYGIGSEIEGRSDIEKFLNEIMEENENVVVVTSNGNEGPGISSTGNPAGASRILSAGAMLPVGSARDSYGFADDGDRIFHFSSRGGELNKPDCLTPGAAASTVPAYRKGENMWGTSMACPQLAGAAAVLISACLQENIPYNGALIKRALKNSAVPLPGYNALDQGTGVIDIPRAFEILKLYARGDEADKLLDYEIETACPFYNDEKGTTAYWRTGGYFPAATEKQIFSVKPIFPKDKTADEKQAFYRAYDLKADQPWIKLDKSSTFIRSDQSATIGCYYRGDLLNAPGLYVGTISAYPKSGVAKAIPEFRLINTVVVPYQFSSQNDYKLTVKNRSLKSGTYHRYFVLVPAGASAMNVKVSASADKWCGVQGYVYDPEGVEKGRVPRMDPDKKESVTTTITQEELMPGIWEIIPFAFHNLTRISTYDLEVSFDGIEIEPVVSLKYENGGKPGGRITAVSHFNRFSGSAEGKLTGYRKKTRLEIDSDEYNHSFKTDNNITRVDFKLAMDKKTFNRFTDIAVNIKDEDGKVLSSGGFTQRSTSIGFSPPGAGTYKLEIIAGFTYPKKKKDKWFIDLVETFTTEESIDISVKKNGTETFELYPSIPVELDFECVKTPKLTPDGYVLYGELVFTDRIGSKTAAALPIEIGNKVLSP